MAGINSEIAGMLAHDKEVLERRKSVRVREDHEEFVRDHKEEDEGSMSDSSRKNVSSLCVSLKEGGLMGSI
jgi:U3 small nucleolar RNA-associated protein 14